MLIGGDVDVGIRAVGVRQVLPLCSPPASHRRAILCCPVLWNALPSHQISIYTTLSTIIILKNKNKV